MARKLIAKISQSAIQHNFKCIHEIVKDKKIIAMIKADGYGHGLVCVAQALLNTMQKTDAFGVACIEEAIQLREAGVTADIVLMEGIFSIQELPLVEQYGFIQVVHSAYQFEFLKNSSSRFKVWLKINTGMNRLGFLPEQFERVFHKISDLKNIEIIGFMTHFANADDRQDTLKSMTKQQRDLFFKTVGHKKGEHSLANSAAIIDWPDCHGDWVRPGLLLTGVSPFLNTTGADLGLLPAMTLESQLIAVQKVGPNETVGYAGIWKNTDSTEKTIGIVAVGYADGYPRHAKNGTPVLIGNQLVPLVGRVSMDMIAVDLTSLISAQLPVNIGDKVVLWGQGLPIEIIAAHADTIPYELLCKLTRRVERCIT